MPVLKNTLKAKKDKTGIKIIQNQINKQSQKLFSIKMIFKKTPSKDKIGQTYI